MLRLTKIFHFETAHALYGYEGACSYIHGHSYTLHVTIANQQGNDDYIPSPGIILDFKELKQMVTTAVISHFDHRLLLSEQYIKANVVLATDNNIFVMEAEPSAENMLIFIRGALEKVLPVGIRLAALKLFETADSYAEWNNDNM
jgi:6-pyruvoyltetrahydropterin/6-carboxytetrahydropterin synthase